MTSGLNTAQALTIEYARRQGLFFQDTVSASMCSRLCMNYVLGHASVG